MHPSTMTIGLVSLICCSPVMYYLLASRLLLLTRTKFPPYFLQLLFIDLIFFEPNQTLCILPLWVIFVNDCQTSVTFKCEEQNPAIASNVSLLTRPNVSLSTRQKSVQPLLGSSGHRRPCNSTSVETMALVTRHSTHAIRGSIWYWYQHPVSLYVYLGSTTIKRIAHRPGFRLSTQYYGDDHCLLPADTSRLD